MISNETASEQSAVSANSDNAPDWTVAHGLAPLLVPALAQVVGIDGLGGSGKSSFAAAVVDQNPDMTVVHLDDFYRPVSERADDPLLVAGANYDLPRLVRQVINPLRAGRDVRYQRYDWDADRLADWVDVPTRRVVVEGTYCLSDMLRSMFHYRVWIETPAALRLQRGVERDGENMRCTWTDVWMPAENAYMRTQNPRADADLIVDGGVPGPVYRILRSPATTKNGVRRRSC